MSDHQRAGWGHLSAADLDQLKAEIEERAPGLMDRWIESAPKPWTIIDLRDRDDG